MDIISLIGAFILLVIMVLAAKYVLQAIALPEPIGKLVWLLVSVLFLVVFMGMIGHPLNLPKL